MGTGGKSIPNKGDGMEAKKTNVCCNQFCGREPLVHNNKTLTELLLYGRHMARYKARRNRNSLRTCGINETPASFHLKSKVVCLNQKIT